MEIILGHARRRWSEDEKRALVAETLSEGETVHGVARRHNISRSMLFCWRKQYRGSLSRTAPASTPVSFTPVAAIGIELTPYARRRLCNIAHISRKDVCR